MSLDPTKKLDVDEILTGLADYRPKRKGWHWREAHPSEKKEGSYRYEEISKPLTQSLPLPAGRYFDNIDPQPQEIITAEIASGRFEDDLRRMRMAAWHGADHIWSSGPSDSPISTGCWKGRRKEREGCRSPEKKSAQVVKRWT